MLKHTTHQFADDDGDDDDDDENVSTVETTLFVVLILNGCDHKCAYMLQRLRCLFPHAYVCTYSHSHVAIKLWQNIGNGKGKSGKTVYQHRMKNNKLQWHNQMRQMNAIHSVIAHFIYCLIHGIRCAPPSISR